MKNANTSNCKREHIERHIKSIEHGPAHPFNDMRIDFDSMVDSDLGSNGSLVRFKLLTNDGKKYPMIAKLLPGDDEVRGKAPAENLLFKHECLTYNKLFPIIEEFLVKKDKKSKFLRAKCYIANNTKYDEVVILEDIHAKGFKLSNKRPFLPLNESLLVIEQLASFHALNIILKNDDFKEYKRLSDSISPVLMSEESGTFFDVIISALNDFQIDFGPAKEVVEKFQALNFLKMVELYSKGCEYRHRILCHEDTWFNNIMFRYKDLDIPIEAFLLDWQELKISSPAHDLLFFIFTSVDVEIRKLHFKTFIDKYYSKLCNEIANLGGNAKHLYPEDAFKEDLSTYSAPALFRFLFIMLISMEKTPIEALLGKKPNYFKKERVSKEYKMKVKQTFQDIRMNELDIMWSDFM